MTGVLERPTLTQIVMPAHLPVSLCPVAAVQTP